MHQSRLVQPAHGAVLRPGQLGSSVSCTLAPIKFSLNLLELCPVFLHDLSCDGPGSAFGTSFDYPGKTRIARLPNGLGDHAIISYLGLLGIARRLDLIHRISALENDL